MGDVVGAMEALVSTLEQHGSPVRDWLRAGRPIESLQAPGLPIAVPPDVVALFSWHDGVDLERDPDQRPDLFYYYEFVPFDLALDSYVDALEHVVPSLWSPAWFPVLSGSAGDVIAISAHPADAGTVWWVFLDDAPKPIFPTFQDAVRAAVYAVDVGNLVVDPGDHTLQSAP